jgi:hypothetical protein
LSPQLGLIPFKEIDKFVDPFIVNPVEAEHPPTVFVTVTT